MAREIELKVPLSEQQFSHLKEIIQASQDFKNLSFHSLSHIIKSDEYFSRYKTHEERKKNNELKVIRIRSEKKLAIKPSGIDIFGDESENNETSYFCIKQKTLENGVEFNSEHETKVENPEVLRAFFKASGYIKWFEKKKDSYSVYCLLKEGRKLEFEAHLELLKVNGLSYIEIEYTKETPEADKVRLLLEKILLALEIDPEKRDKRSWAEIINS